VVRPLWSLAGPAVGAVLAAGLLSAPVGPLASAVQRYLGLSTAAVVVSVVAAYAVALVVMVVPGYLLGRRWPTAGGVPALALVMVGSLVTVAAPGALLLTVGRVVAGLGAGTVVGVAFALSGQVDVRRSRARLVLGIALGAGFLLGPAVSGLVAMVLSWRIAFLLGAPVALVALAGTVAAGIAMAVRPASRPSPPTATAPFPEHAGNPPARSGQ
jgi:MFS family permease